MKDCFLVKIVSLYTLLHFILLQPLAVFAAVPKFIQLTPKSNFIVDQVSTLNTEVNFFQFEFDCFNTDVVIDEIGFKAFGDYVSDYFDSFDLLNLTTDNVLSTASLSNGFVTFTENFECLNNSTLHLVVVGKLSEQVDRDFSFGLKMLSDDYLELSENLLEYAEFPLLGDLVSLTYVEVVPVEPEVVVPEEVESEQEDVLSEIMTKMHEILDVQKQAQLDVNNFFVDSLGRIQTRTEALQDSISERDAEFNAQIAELVTLIGQQGDQLDLNQLVEFIQENQPEGINEQELTAAVVREINNLLPKSQEVVLVDDSILDMSNVGQEKLDEVVSVLAELMDQQAQLQLELERVAQKEAPVLGSVSFEQGVVDNSSNFVNPFVDLIDGSELALGAFELFRRGVVSGYTNGFFMPGKSINRAEALKIILSLRFGEIGLLPAEIDFLDVKSEDWFYKYVVMGSYLEVVSGFDDGTFRPFENVTLAQFLKMMSRVFELPLNLESGLSASFEGEWYEPFVGIVDKFDLWEATGLDFNHELSRGDSVLVLYRFLKNR